MTFGILIFPQVEELDFVGPWELVNLWKQVEGGPRDCILVAQSLEQVVCARGLSVKPQTSFNTCPALDFLLVPGGQGTRSEVNNPQLIDFVSRQAPGCRAVLSVCTGAFLLQASGLLDGRTATTHWGSLDRLRALGTVRVVEERFTRDGPIWCSAGISAGMDLTLRLIADVAGEEAAGKVQLAAEYFPDTRFYGTCRSHPQAPAYIRQA